MPRLVRVNEIRGFEDNDGIIRYIWLEDLIENNLAQLFPKIRITRAHLFRLIRNADVEIEEDEAGDLLKTIEKGIRSRRYGKVVRLDITPAMPVPVRKLLMKNL